MTLPIDSLIPQLQQLLQQHSQLLLEAAPGAGKSSRVPLALLDAPWLQGQKILLLEPRRLAARALARYMATLLGESVGEQVGYRMRLESKVGPNTRLEVITEGVLTRLLQNDPTLEGIGCVIFDEFHERSLQADLGLALALDAQQGLREDLRLVVMSATLDTAAMQRLMPDAPRLVSEGRVFPVETVYLGEVKRQQVVFATATAIEKALAAHAGNVLVFLPGQGEIRKVASQLAGRVAAHVDVVPLYGGLDNRAQDQAISVPPKGRCKVVLATNLAETSLTIEGISVVVDSGLERRYGFDPRSGMGRLQLFEASTASVDQRRGRAGRLQAGHCYRLWSQSTIRQAHAPAEIETQDLSDLLLQLYNWGVASADDLSWVSTPPAAHLSQARDVLQANGAITKQSKLTPHGQRMARLGLQPRLANMVLRGMEHGCGVLACDIAALLGERNPFTGQEAERDFDMRLRLLQHQAPTRFKGAVKQIRQQSQQWQRTLKLPEDVGELSAGELLAFAYPERIAMQRNGQMGRYKLASGQGAAFAEEGAAVALEPWLLVTELDGREREARIYSAAALSESAFTSTLADLVSEREQVSWDDASESVRAVRQQCIGKLVLDESELASVSPEQVSKALLQAIRKRGLACLPWTDKATLWLSRARFSQRFIENAPDLSDEALLTALDEWLLPWLEGVTSFAALQRLELKSLLQQWLGWQLQQRIETLAPERLSVASGSYIRIDYSKPEDPVLAVRIQEVFGSNVHPTLAEGRYPVLLHLLSPARRPVQITRDLPGFWQGSYVEVRKEMKGRYPRHNWPENPAETQAHTGIRAKS